MFILSSYEVAPRSDSEDSEEEEEEEVGCLYNISETISIFTVPVTDKLLFPTSGRRKRKSHSHQRLQ